VEPLLAVPVPVVIRALPEAALLAAEREGRLSFRLCAQLCAGCGHVFLDPPPAEAQLRLMYDHYTFHSPLKLERGYASAERLAFEAVMLPRLPPGPLDILEIGCSEGLLLAALRGRGHRVVGCEPGPLGRHGREVLGLDIRPVFFAEAGFPDSSYDIVIHRHLIEHVPDGVEFVRQVARVLRPGGRLVMETPSYRAWLASGRLTALMPEHVMCYSRPSLVRVLAAAGFVVTFHHEHIEQYLTAERGPAVPFADGEEIAAVVATARGYARGVARRVEAARALLAGAARLACYGASAHAAMAAAHLDLPALADALLVDENPDTWGKRLPGYRRAIEPPRALAAAGSGIDLVLIQSFAHPGSIVEGLRALGCAGQRALAFYPEPALLVV
jgi:SAM-dependent methyltransferase